jgi:hypothetical protein
MEGGLMNEALRMVDEIDKRLKPLTDEQIIEIWQHYAGDTKLTVLAFARAIERKHGISWS